MIETRRKKTFFPRGSDKRSRPLVPGSNASRYLRVTNTMMAMLKISRWKNSAAARVTSEFLTMRGARENVTRILNKTLFCYTSEDPCLLYYSRVHLINFIIYGKKIFYAITLYQDGNTLTK